MIFKVIINILIMLVGAGIIFFISEFFFEGINSVINKYKHTKKEDYFNKYIKFPSFFVSFALGVIWLVLSFFYLTIPGSLEVIFGGFFDIIKNLLNLTVGNVLFGIIYLIIIVPLVLIIFGIYLIGPVWLASKIKDKLVFSNNLFYKKNEKVIKIIASLFYFLWLISPGWIINQLT